MNFSTSDAGELYSFSTRLCGITIEAKNIKEFSSFMRRSNDPVIQSKILQIWLNNVKQTSDHSRLLALIYLANDVIQLLRGDQYKVMYRYKFAVTLAESIVFIRQQAPVLIHKVERIIVIFKERLVYDSYVILLLEKCLSSTIDSVISTILPELVLCTTVKLKEHMNLLESETNQKYSSSSSSQSSSKSTHIEPIPKYIPSNLLVINKHSNDNLNITSTNDPLNMSSSQELIQIVKELENHLVCRRSEESINIDAEILSRMRSYRVPSTSKITEIDNQLISVYKHLLFNELQNYKNVEDKVQRRRIEEKNNIFQLIPESNDQSTITCASKRVQILLKKEWNLRCKSCQIEHALYWHLISLLNHLVNRWKKIQLIIQGVETETRRRTEADKSVVL